MTLPLQPAGARNNPQRQRRLTGLAWGLLSLGFGLSLGLMSLPVLAVAPAGGFVLPTTFTTTLATTLATAPGAHRQISLPQYDFTQSLVQHQDLSTPLQAPPPLPTKHNRLSPPVPTNGTPPRQDTSSETPLPVSHTTQAPAFHFQADAQVRQGQVIRVQLRDSATAPWKGARVRLGSYTVPLYAQAALPEREGALWQAWLPVGVVHPTGKHTLVLTNPAGTTVASQTVTILPGQFRRQNITVSRSVGGLKPLPGELEAIDTLKKLSTPVRYWQEPLQLPVPDCMNSPFGVLRYHNGTYTGDYHKGLDQRAPAGRPVKAIAAGVVHISKSFRLHGDTVGLDHGQGVSSVYIHLSKRTVQEGASVKPGQTIGLVGSTGFATGPHLHWGLYMGGLPVNPLQWISNMPRCGA
ncbi:MAG: peptidoglycan DD-metalloendopeptidase family protein [Candidatus Melainabacteria bacterium]|nr:peptidoglycan DD-metalloendopeptidase family protein [Candidatus Melainabacteria bacterium]